MPGDGVRAGQHPPTTLATFLLSGAVRFDGSISVPGLTRSGGRCMVQ